MRSMFTLYLLIGLSQAAAEGISLRSEWKPNHVYHFQLETDQKTIWTGDQILTQRIQSAISYAATVRPGDQSGTVLQIRFLRANLTHTVNHQAPTVFDLEHPSTPQAKAWAKQMRTMEQLVIQLDSNGMVTAIANLEQVLPQFEGSRVAQKAMKQISALNPPSLIPFLPRQPVSAGDSWRTFTDSDNPGKARFIRESQQGGRRIVHLEHHRKTNTEGDPFGWNVKDKLLKKLGCHMANEESTRCEFDPNIGMAKRQSSTVQTTAEFRNPNTGTRQSIASVVNMSLNLNEVRPLSVAP